MRRVSKSEREVTARTVPMVLRVGDDESEETHDPPKPMVTNKTSETAGDCHIKSIVCP